MAARPQRRPKPKRRLPPEVLTDDEVRALLDACGRYTPVALRNRALITLMYRAGLRVSEALALQPKDVDLENGIVRVLHGKGDRYRAVGLDPGAAAVVAAWLAERGRGPRGPVHLREAAGSPRIAPRPLPCNNPPTRKGDPMRALRSKVAKMEQARKVESEAGRDDHRRMMQMLNGALVAHQPGLEQVRPEHTDPETYRDIQETLAWARGDYAEAERLHDLDPDKYVPPPPGTPWEEQMRLAREALNRTLGDGGDKTERVRLAVVAADAAHVHGASNRSHQ